MLNHNFLFRFAMSLLLAICIVLAVGHSKKLVAGVPGPVIIPKPVVPVPPVISDAAKAHAAFDAALMKILALYESPQAKAVAAMFNQVEPKLDTLNGPASYLSEWSKVNASEVSLNVSGNMAMDTAGPYWGRIDLYRNQYTVPKNCSMQFMTIRAKNLNRDVNLNVWLPVQATEPLYVFGKPFSTMQKILFNLNAGTVLPIQNVLHICGQDVSVSVGLTTKNYVGAQAVSGQVKISEISTAYGGKTKIELNNIVFPMGSQPPVNITANGYISDELLQRPAADKYIPFTKKANLILGAVQPGTTIADFQAQLRGLIPALQDIDGLLATVSGYKDMQFVIHKELYFGAKDLLLNQTDIKAMQAGIDSFMAAIYLINSWSFPMTLSGIMDASGHLIMTKADLVNALNQMFALKSDPEVAQAQVAFTAALKHLLDMKLSLQSVTQDGVFDNDPQTLALYDELEKTALILQKSLNSGDTAFTFLDPPININLQAFFSAPPDGSDTALGDPFVLDNNRINTVESYFSNLLAGIVDIDFATSYKHLYKVIKKGYRDVGFDEFSDLMAAGFVLKH